MESQLLTVYSASALSLFAFSASPLSLVELCLFGILSRANVSSIQTKNNDGRRLACNRLQDIRRVTTNPWQTKRAVARWSSQCQLSDSGSWQMAGSRPHQLTPSLTRNPSPTRNRQARANGPGAVTVAGEATRAGLVQAESRCYVQAVPWPSHLRVHCVVTSTVATDSLQHVDWLGGRNDGQHCGRHTAPRHKTRTALIPTSATFLTMQWQEETTTMFLQEVGAA